MLDINFAFVATTAFLLVLTSVALWVRAMRRVSIPKNRSAFIVSWLLGGGLAVAALLLGNTSGLATAAAWFAALMAGLLLFMVMISKQQLDDRAIGKGHKIPAFSARDEFGKLFDSRELAGKFVLIKFFRGHW